MKPTFALDFRNDTIALLHRTQRGWSLVGQIAVDAPDLADALGYLRSTALGLSPRGLTTKLVIPNSQVLYTSVRAPAPDAARRRKQVTRGLEGLTPYAVADLAFDMSGAGPDVQVAVIARETLAEAEAFAAEHRFNPMSFVAIPENGSFDGEAWFGPTTLAASLLPDGERVERDAEPLTILSREMPGKAPEAPPAVAVAPAPTRPDAQALPDPAPAPEPPPVVAAPVAEPERPATRQPPEPEPVVAADPAPALPDTPPAQTALAEPEEVLARAVAEPLPGPDPVPVPVAPEIAPAAAKPVDEAPIALDVVDDLPEPAASSPAQAAKVTDTSILDDVPPPPAASILMAFSSRRAAETAKDGPGAKAGGRASAKVTAGKAPVLTAVSASRTAPPPSRIAQIAPRKGAESTEAPSLTVVTDAGVQLAQPAKEAQKSGSATKALRGLGALVTAPGIPGTKPRRPMVQTTPAASPNAAASAAAATLTRPGAKPYGGGLGSRNLQPRGKPRYLGLILTGILLVFLALVAAWSTFFLTRNENSTAEATAVAATEATTESTPESTTGADPAIEDEMLADLQDPAELAGTTAPPADTPLEAVAALPDPEPAPAPAPDTEVSTETVASPGPLADPQDEIFLSSMDQAPDMPDALSLPRPAAQSDPPPSPTAPPPPFGTVYQFDADGLIVPTPEGILTPEGVLLFAGPPQLVPPPRPATLAPVATTAPAPDPVPETAPETAPEAAFAADPALAGARPRARPATLVAPTINADDDASLAPAAGSRFASLRPRPRPPELVQVAAPAADLGAQAASLTAQAAANAAANTAAAPLSPLAVTVSRKPEPRPKDMSRAVEAAVAAAVQQPERKPQPEAPEQEPATEADEEPEIAKAMPRLPTKASVAKQATFVNAINLSKVNLIGVYGTQSNRHALVRLSSGRYKKVSVGDSFDGGRVAAITASELRYQKSGKMVTLALPKG